MKKWVSFAAVTVFLVIPLAANASLLGYGDLNVSHSPPTGGGYYLDYDGAVVSSSFGYTTGLEEVFCVSREIGNDGNYNFYEIDSDLSNFASLAQAAWIADHWIDYGTTETAKGEAQKAVWKITGVMDIVGTDGMDYQIYLAASEITGYLTNNWYYADSLSGYQDYLTPVPEPATMLLLGSGLVGLAGLARRRFRK